MNSKKTGDNHQHAGILRKLDQKYSSKKGLLPPYSKYYREPQKWHCRDCALIFTSEMQEREHFFGKRHQNVLKTKIVCDQHYDSQSCGKVRQKLISCDKPQDSFRHYWGSRDEVCNFRDIIPPPGRDNILETVIKSEKRPLYSSDLSIYRTPSGKYYCQPCNLTVNSQGQFLQHSESRKHKQKAGKSSFKIK